MKKAESQLSKERGQKYLGSLPTNADMEFNFESQQYNILTGLCEEGKDKEEAERATFGPRAL